MNNRKQIIFRPPALISKNNSRMYLDNLNKEETNFLIGNVLHEAGCPEPALNDLVKIVFTRRDEGFTDSVKNLIVDALVESHCVHALEQFLKIPCPDYTLSNETCQKVLHMSFTEYAVQVPGNLRILEALVKRGDLNKNNLYQSVPMVYNCKELTSKDQVTISCALWAYYIDRLNALDCKSLKGVDFYRGEVKRILSPIGWVESAEDIHAYEYAKLKESKLKDCDLSPEKIIKPSLGAYVEMLDELLTVDPSKLTDNDPFGNDLLERRLGFWLKYIRPVQDLRRDEMDVFIDNLVIDQGYTFEGLCRILIAADEKALSYTRIASFFTDFISECHHWDINYYLDIGFITKDKVGKTKVGTSKTVLQIIEEEGVFNRTPTHFFDVKEAEDMDLSHFDEILIPLLKLRLQQLSNDDSGLLQKTKKLKQ